MANLTTGGRGGRWLLLVSVVAVVAVALGIGSTPAGAASGPTTERVSVSSTGEEANSYSEGPSISADGRFVAFESEATNLVGNDTNASKDVFVYDRSTDKTRLVSVNSDGAEGNDASYRPSISADGQFVAFYSYASNLVLNDTNSTTDVFVYDQSTHKTRLVSVNSAGTQGNRYSSGPSISANGRFVAFESDASNLVRHDTNSTLDVFVYDRSTQKTQRVSVNSAGTQGHNYSFDPAISANGRFVAFTSHARNLVANDTNGSKDVFVYDRSTHKTRRVSVDSVGTQGNASSNDASISAHGQFVAFTSAASNLVGADTNTVADVFVYDRSTHKTRRISVTAAGTDADNASHGPSISAHGQFVAFFSYASNLVDADTNTVADVFVYDRSTHETRRVSVSAAGTAADNASYVTSISAHGRFVAFSSYASNLVGADTNTNPDIFVRGPLR